MLYERWLEIARTHPDRLALWDGAMDRHWSFAELAKVVGELPVSERPVQFIHSKGVGFVFDVLCAWRDGRMVVPLESGQAVPTFAKVPYPDIVHLKTTSATTGVSRLIAFTAGQLVADCEHICKSMGLNPTLPNVGAISLAHSYGFSNLVLPLLLKGVPLLLAGSALPESVRIAIGQAPAVALPSVPALWQAWHDAGIISRRIHIAISAGAPLPKGLEQAVFDSVGVKVHNFYGSSECGGIAYDRSESPRTDATFVGTPMDGVRISLNDDGCVTVRSEAVGAGYWPQPDPNLGDGLFQTGDLGGIVDGKLHLRGRACDRINVAGRKVIPEEVERALALHPAVEDCLVFGIPSDNVRNETIVACVANDSNLTSRELAEFLQARLPGWQIPREWWLVESLGANERGKRSRNAWRERYLSEGRTAS